MSEDDFDGAQSQPLKAAEPPLNPFEEAVRKKSYFTPEELLAWRTYMRANPEPPEPTKKPHYRPESGWEKPQEWMRRDGAEQ